LCKRVVEHMAERVGQFCRWCNWRWWQWRYIGKCVA